MNDEHLLEMLLSANICNDVFAEMQQVGMTDEEWMDAAGRYHNVLGWMNDVTDQTLLRAIVQERAERGGEGK